MYCQQNGNEQVYEQETVLPEIEKKDENLAQLSSNYHNENKNKDEMELISDDNSDLQYHILNIKPGDHHCFMKHHHIVNHYLEILLQKTIKK